MTVLAWIIVAGLLMAAVALLFFAVAVSLFTFVGRIGDLPKLLGAVIPVNEAVFGPTLFIFLCWIFINVHHYCLDNVMWRRGNPDTGRYLFSHR